MIAGGSEGREIEARERDREEMNTSEEKENKVDDDKTTMAADKENKEEEEMTFDDITEYPINSDKEEKEALRGDNKYLLYTEEMEVISNFFSLLLPYPRRGRILRGDQDHHKGGVQQGRQG